MALSKQYHNLKRNIIEKAGSNFRLEEIKELFAADINSRRALRRVRSLGSIIQLLEERDVLHSKNVSALHSLGELLQCNEIKGLVREYKKFYLDTPDYTCICGCSGTATLSPLLQQEQNQASVLRNPIQNNNRELDEALENISINVGKEWAVLARELHLVEREIDFIRDTFPGNMVQQARQALNIWRKKNQENASIALLDKALETRMCRRKGLGIHLRKPIMGLTNLNPFTT